MEPTVIKFVFTAAFGVPSLFTVVMRTMGRAIKFLSLYQFLACSSDKLSGACKDKEIFLTKISSLNSIIPL